MQLSTARLFLIIGKQSDQIHTTTILVWKNKQKNTNTTNVQIINYLFMEQIYNILKEFNVKYIHAYKWTSKKPAKFLQPV